ncbi:NFX1-type zinc finger-containing protein 1-like [Artemia franciscana]|uniref:NFX1-type zinc finger-containing protein 1-like n=1 Tax=Artemia franciscana TaxID=6661 RepID=UPI0032DA0675
MDYWMKSASKDLVGLQRCPRCNTPISSFIGRYGNVIRQTFRDTEEVKAQFYTAKDVSTELAETQLRVTRCKAMVDEDNLIIRSGTDSSGIHKAMAELIKRISTTLDKQQRPKRGGKKLLSMSDDSFHLTKVQAAILCDLASITTKGTAKSSATDFSTRLEKDKIFPMKDTYRTLLVSKVSSLANNCIGRSRISQQEADDFILEIVRLEHLKCFYCILSVPNYQHLYSNSKSQGGDDFASRIDSVASSLKGCKKLSPDESAAIKSNLEKLLKEASVHGVGIPDYERKMVVQAMGLKQGHWYKCPNGHIYCIGDCGGAMMESRCNECGEIIGGESHRLRSDNTLAREMDGARELGEWWILAGMTNLTINPVLFKRIVPDDQSFDDGEYAGIFHFRL